VVEDSEKISRNKTCYDPFPPDSINFGAEQREQTGVEKKYEQEQRVDVEAAARILEEKLERFGVHGTVAAIKQGPAVTLFEYQPAIDTKLSKIVSLEDDLALALQFTKKK